MSSWLRQLRWRSNIFNLGARVNGPAYTNAGSGPHPEILRLQRVRFRRKWVKRAVTTGIVYYACYTIWKNSVLSPLSNWLDEQDAAMSEKERRELEKELAKSEPLFLPLPFTTREVEPQPYKGSDPEWQQFAKFSRDMNLTLTVQKSLAEMARGSIERHPQLSKTCGKDIKIKQVWFEFDYPYKPPPTFERTGIQLDNDGTISIEKQTIDAATVFKIRRILWPSSMVQSLLAFHGALLKQNVEYVAKAFGYEFKPEKPKSDMQQAMDRAREALEKTQQSKGDPKQPNPNSLSAATKKQAADGSTADTTSVDKKTSTSAAMSPRSASAASSGISSGPVSPNGPGQGGKSSSARDIYGIREMAEHTSGPWQEFKKKFAKTWRPWNMPPNYPPRGSILVTGMVEVTGPRANIVVDMFAWFDPKNKTIDPWTIKMNVRNVKPRQRTPLK